MFKLNIKKKNLKAMHQSKETFSQEFGFLTTSNIMQFQL
jgi:hypothetical protein